MSAPARVSGLEDPPVHDRQDSRRLEAAAQAALPSHTLMARAGLSLARLAIALAPQARRVGIAIGPGNNGGDGLVAASHLTQAGVQVLAVSVKPAPSAGGDAAWAAEQARQAGITVSHDPTELGALGAKDLLIDALLGLGTPRPPSGLLARLFEHAHQHPGPRLAVDLPTGLDADTGQPWAHPLGALRVDHTLSLLSLKPGLFTGRGRDLAGEVWLDRLGVEDNTARIWLATGHPCVALAGRRAHASHKGSHGDVAVVGGAPGMSGAAVLAAHAALIGGAGRVYLASLTDQASGSRAQPALPAAIMTRHPGELSWPELTVVCGCGGGQAVHAWLGPAVRQAARLVLDADGLNLLADSPPLQALLRLRGATQPTVLTPHPLEAARLLGLSGAGQVQADRLGAARELAQRLQAVVLLKGSGSVIADPDGQCWINSSGDARLATAGTGDVLAGLCAAGLAQGRPATLAARTAAWSHGQAASSLPASVVALPADRLIDRLGKA